MSVQEHDVQDVTPAGGSMDPVTFSVVRNGLMSASSEMYWAFKRTTMLPVLYEQGDFAMAIYDEKLRLIAESPGCPIFSGSLDDAIDRAIKAVGHENLVEGDVLMTTHPGMTGAQPPDAVYVEPWYLDGRLIGYGAMRAHTGDFGGKGFYPTDTTEVYQEGLLLPSVKLVEAGVPNQTILRIIEANSRIPLETVGNTMASVGALGVGRQRIMRVLRTYGLDVYHEAIEGILEHGERVARTAVEQIPDGVYTVEDYLDDDGVNRDVPVKMVVTVTVKGGSITVDTTGSADQLGGPMNMPWGYTLSSARMAIKRLASPDLPSNGGEHRVLTLIAPEGSMFNPFVPPAPSFLSFEPGVRLVDMITIALAPVLPEKLPAPHPGSMAVMLSLIADPENGRVSFQGDPQPLGQGAIKGADGPSALPHATAAGEQMIAAEIVESRAPIRRIRSELVQNSSGAGQFRGGLGALIEYEALGEGQGVIVFDKTKASPTLGVAGGKGPRYENQCIYYAGTDRERLVGKESDLALKPGDRYIAKTAGGGGYGDPLDRELSAVARDVKFEYITPDVALEDYGVVFTADGELDEEATAKERSDRRARR